MNHPLFGSLDWNKVESQEYNSEYHREIENDDEWNIVQEVAELFVDINKDFINVPGFSWASESFTFILT